MSAYLRGRLGNEGEESEEEEKEIILVESNKSILPNQLTKRRTGKIKPLFIHIEEGDVPTFSELCFSSNGEETDEGTYTQYTPLIVTNHDKNTVRSDPHTVVFTDKKTQDRSVVRRTGQAHYELRSSDINKRWVPDVTNMMFSQCIEGVKITAWYHGSKWWFSTHRRINGLRGKWASNRTFGDRLIEILSEHLDPVVCMDMFKKMLDKNVIYEFILPHDKSERIVCDVPVENNTIKWVDAYWADTFEQLSLEEMERHLKKPVLFDDIVEIRNGTRFDNVDDLIIELDSLSPFNTPGLIGYHKDGYRVKIILDEYMELFELRGNVPSIKFRYLQLRNTTHINKFRSLYLEHTELFNSIENEIMAVKQYITTSYCNRYMMRNTTPRAKWDFFISPACFSVVKECHEYYKKCRETNRINYEVVSILVDSYPASRVNHLLKGFHRLLSDPDGEKARFDNKGARMRSERR